MNIEVVFYEVPYWNVLYEVVEEYSNAVKHKQLITKLLLFTQRLGYGLRTLNTLTQNRNTRIIG